MNASMLAALLLAGCGCGETSAPAPAPAVAPSTSIEAPAEPSAAIVATPVEATSPPALPLAGPILAGDLLSITSSTGTDVMLMIELADEPGPAPEGSIAGRTHIHHAVMVYRELPAPEDPPERATLVGLEPDGRPMRCEARVSRAHRYHVTFVSTDDHRASDTDVFLGLELAPGCDGWVGVIGTSEVSVVSLRSEGMRPAPSALAAEILPLDADWRGPADTLRMVSLPEADLEVLEGRSPWLLVQGRRARFADVAPEVSIHFVVSAGWRTLLYLENHITDERLVRSMLPFVDGLRMVSCVVADTSGTPLNVRRRPRADGEVIATLPNDLVIDGIAGSSSWVRLATDPAGWAHTSGLRCSDEDREVLP